MSALVYDYKSIAANMKGELAPGRLVDILGNGSRRQIVEIVHEQLLPVRCLECGSCGVQQYCANTRCPWQTY